MIVAAWSSLRKPAAQCMHLCRFECEYHAVPARPRLNFLHVEVCAPPDALRTRSRVILGGSVTRSKAYRCELRCLKRLCARPQLKRSQTFLQIEFNLTSVPAARLQAREHAQLLFRHHQVCIYEVWRDDTSKPSVAGREATQAQRDLGGAVCACACLRAYAWERACVRAV
eukprot:6192258-Pleurochrysis_carterae.AAC.2